MNMQAMVQQAQKIQKEIINAKNEINNKIYEANSSFVTVKVKGSKEVVEVKIDKESLDSDNIEMLEDMIVVAINTAIKKIDKETDEKIGKYTQGMPGLF
jgi:DNA-binding YbaB/EbfC family protein